MQAQKTKWAIALVLATGIAAMRYVDIQIEAAEQLFGGTNVHPIILFLAGGTAALIMLVPKTPISILGGIIFGWWLGTLLMFAVALLAATTNYYLGRFLFRSAINRFELKSNQRVWIPALRNAAREANVYLHFLVRLTPVPTSIISYSMGASGSRLFPFLLGTLLAVIPQSLWINVGANYGQLEASQMTTAKILSLTISLLAAIAVAVWIPKIVQAHIRSSQFIEKEQNLDRIEI